MKKIMYLILIFFISLNSVFAEEFTPDDYESCELMCKTLEKWYQLNQLGLPKSESELKKIINILFYIRNEANKISDTFLRKFTSFASP